MKECKHSCHGTLSTFASESHFIKSLGDSFRVCVVWSNHKGGWEILRKLGKDGKSLLMHKCRIAKSCSLDSSFKTKDLFIKEVVNLYMYLDQVSMQNTLYHKKM